MNDCNEIKRRSCESALLATQNAMKIGLADHVRGAVAARQAETEIEAAHVCGYLTALADVDRIMLDTAGADGTDAMISLLDTVIKRYKNQTASVN